MKSTLLLLVSAVAINSWSGNRTAFDWKPVSEYLAIHALNFDPDIDARLCDEALSGQKTWGLCSTSLLAAPVNGPGLGWPCDSEVLRFATPAERDKAATLILDVTYQRRPSN